MSPQPLLLGWHLGLSLLCMTLAVLERTDWVSCSMSLILGLSDVPVMIRMGLWVCRENHRVRCPFHLIISGIADMHVTYHRDVTWIAGFRWWVTTNLVTRDNTNLFPQSSGGEKSKIKCQQDRIPSGGSRGGSFIVSPSFWGLLLVLLS